LTSV